MNARFLWPRAALAALLCVGTAPSAQALSPTLTLKLTHGGALLSGALRVARADELTGVWSSVGRARMLRCTPRCEVVEMLPVPGVLNLGTGSSYRVVLGGTFKVGQKVSLVLRYRNTQITNLMATVAR
ncbi:hypothetical protein [Deinococcus multiflagellatus]|uniref:Uncharacterized protein n=1 Tax=Deinococcus multiflagellatus TaxID=1656887 RepID=A0ABW1ZGM5_9DEIO|nr:hypothetical protein [Deinococcus multiflagellatus]MBZ9714556.1 hypothetical protein [Deinococcus multiflagellatus]